jgi:hypothetical protein
MGWKPDSQFQTSAKTMRIEVGCGSGLDLLDGTHGSLKGESHPVATNLTYVAGGFMMCMSTAGAVSGKPIYSGCVTSQMVPRDHTWGPGYLDFTMEESCEGINQYVLFGW